MSGPNPGSATSAAKMNLKSGHPDLGIKIVVEKGRRISMAEEKRSIDNGADYFWCNPEKPWRYSIRPIEHRHY
jgi:hypothetical protein